jgi:hypothetical protein
VILFIYLRGVEIFLLGFADELFVFKRLRIGTKGNISFLTIVTRNKNAICRVLFVLKLKRGSYLTELKLIPYRRMKNPNPNQLT